MYACMCVCGHVICLSMSCAVELSLEFRPERAAVKCSDSLLLGRRTAMAVHLCVCGTKFITGLNI